MILESMIELLDKHPTPWTYYPGGIGDPDIIHDANKRKIDLDLVVMYVNMFSYLETKKPRKDIHDV